MNKERLINQLLNAITSLVDNNDYFDSIADISPGQEPDTMEIRIELPYPSYREDLLREIPERLSRWKVNPFISIEPKGTDIISFHYRPIDELMEECSRLG
jgi:hypothetical protein